MNRKYRFNDWLYAGIIAIVVILSLIVGAIKLFTYDAPPDSPNTREES